MQVFFLAVLINAAHSALEHTEIALDCIGVDIAAYIFASGMFDGFMARDVQERAIVKVALVGVQHALASNVIDHDLANSGLTGNRHMKRAHVATTLD